MNCNILSLSMLFKKKTVIVLERKDDLVEVIIPLGLNLGMGKA